MFLPPGTRSSSKRPGWEENQEHEVQIAVARTNNYDITESGNALEVVERPNGGLSVVLAAGQTSGRVTYSSSSASARRRMSSSLPMTESGSGSASGAARISCTFSRAAEYMDGLPRDNQVS